MYSYEKEKPEVFKEENQKDFLRVRDNAKRLFTEAGAARLDMLIKGLTGSSWIMLAYVDRLAELGEIRCLNDDGETPAQHRVYVKG